MELLLELYHLRRLSGEDEDEVSTRERPAKQGKTQKSAGGAWGGRERRGWRRPRVVEVREGEGGREEKEGGPEPRWKADGVDG